MSSPVLWLQYLQVLEYYFLSRASTDFWSSDYIAIILPRVPLLITTQPIGIFLLRKALRPAVLLERMCEVTVDNFEELFPAIEEEISSASFVAFDCEFTSLNPDPRQNMKNSLFDNMEERYRKLTTSPLPPLLSQIGLSIFKQLSGSRADQYEARSYNFFVCPRSFASVDHHFACQASSLEFLTRHGFDFNKVFYHGISSLNREQEAKLRADVKEGALFRALDRKLPIQVYSAK